MSIQYKEALRTQVREAYGRLLYTYTCYNKMIDNLSNQYHWLQILQIICSSIATGGLLTAVIVDERAYTIVGCIISTISTGVTLYLKNYKINDQISQLHLASDEAWLIREDYISLLTDFDVMDEKEIATKRDELKQRVFQLYKKYPKTDSKSYGQAQKALKEEEEEFFSVEEIDKMLPQHLRLESNK